MLRDLVSRYAYSVDNRAIDTLADLFAEDAVFRARNGGFSASGRTAIAAEFRSQLNGLGPSFHFVHDHIVDLAPADPDRAWGVATAHAEVRDRESDEEGKSVSVRVEPGGARNTNKKNIIDQHNIYRLNN